MRAPQATGAKQALRESDNEHHLPMSLPETLLMIGILTLNGFLSGSGLS